MDTSVLLDALHRERIAWKRFRYTAEILREADPASCPAACLEALRAQQSLLGSIQDARVFIAALQAARV
jgi:CHAD domain-containing protein